MFLSVPACREQDGHSVFLALELSPGWNHCVGLWAQTCCRALSDVWDSVGHDWGILSFHSSLSTLHWVLMFFAALLFILKHIWGVMPSLPRGLSLFWRWWNNQVFVLSVYLCLAVQRIPRSYGESEEAASADSANCSSASLLCSDLYSEQAADPQG